MSWKKYGGTNNLENLNNLVVNSIVTDVLSVRKYYIGDWDICGALRVKDDSTLFRNALIYGNLDISGANTEIRGNAKISRNTEISGNLIVYDNTYLKKYLYLDPCGNTLIHGTNHAFGLNKYNPTATIDISGDQIFTVKMQTSQSTNRNIYAQNAGQQGIVLGVEPTKSYINMFVDSSMNVGDGTVNAKLEYTKGGDFLLDVSNIMRVRPRMIFSRDIAKNMNSNEEHVVIYDSSELRGVSYPYNYNIYGNANLKSGVALTAISKDSSSNVFMKMTTEQGKGAVIGGGPFEGGIMASLALIDSSASNFSKNIYPAFNVFSGNLISNLKTSIGINKYRVSKTDLNENRYSLDVNGPMKLIHQELLETVDISMQILVVGMDPTKQFIYAFGSPYQISNPYKQLFLKSVDAGYTWTRIDISLSTFTAQTNFENNAASFNTIYVYDNNYVIISTGGLHFYTTNGGLLWNQIVFSNFGGIDVKSIVIINQKQNAIFGLSNGKFYDLDASTTPSIFENNTTNPITVTRTDSSLSSISGVDGSGNIAFFVGGNGIQGYLIDSKTLSPLFNNNMAFNDVSLYFDGSKYHVVAVGNQRISYAHTTTHLSTNWVVLSGSHLSKNFKKVKVVSELLAVALVDDVNNPIAYSNDGFQTWSYLSRTELNSMGNGFVLDNFIFSSIVSTNVNDFVIGGYYKTFVPLSQRGQSKLIHLHAPYLLNRDKNFVLEASGSILLSGDLNVTGNAKICTNHIDAQSNSINNTLKIGNVYASKILIGSTDTTTDIRIGKTDGSLTTSRSTQARIHIGDLNSSVHIYGNLFLPGSVTTEIVTNLEVKNKSIKLNDEAATSSVGAGIYFRDIYQDAIPGNGFFDTGSNVAGDDYAGQFLVNSTRKGFLFKAPASPKYINFDLDNFSVTNGYDKGLVTIKLDSTNNYTVRQRDVEIMDIVNLDVSLNRRVFRNAALTYNASNPNTQVIDDKLAMTGLMINKMQNQIIANTQMDISGNAIITKLGLGTSSVNTNAYGYVLDISGNTWTNGSIIQW